MMKRRQALVIVSLLFWIPGELFASMHLDSARIEVMPGERLAKPAHHATEPPAMSGESRTTPTPNCTTPCLTLAEAIDLALEHSPVLHAAQHEAEMARAGIAQARAGWLPTVSLQEAFTRSNNPTFSYASRISQGILSADAFSAERLNEPTVTNDFHTTLSVAQPLYTGGKASIENAQAKLRYQAQQHHTHRRRQEVIFAVAKSYHDILLAQAKLLAVQSALKTAEANVRFAQDRVATGLVVESDLLSAEVRLARLQEHEITAAHQLILTQAALNDAMGVSLDTQWTIDDRLNQHPGQYAAVETLRQRALANRPDYQKLRLDEKIMERQVALTRAAFLPTLSVKAQYDINNKYFATTGQDSWLVGAVLQWNLFNGFADHARMAEAQAEFSRLQALRAQMTSRVGLEVQSAVLQLQAAEKRISVARRAVHQAETSLRIVADRYQAGLSSIVDLLAGEEALTQAKGNLAHALYDWNVGLAALELTLGSLDQNLFGRQ